MILKRVEMKHLVSCLIFVFHITTQLDNALDKFKDEVELPDGSRGEVTEVFKNADKLFFFKIKKEEDGSIITVDQTKAKLVARPSGRPLSDFISLMFK